MLLGLFHLVSFVFALYFIFFIGANIYNKYPILTIIISFAIIGLFIYYLFWLLVVYQDIFIFFFVIIAFLGAVIISYFLYKDDYNLEIGISIFLSFILSLVIYYQSYVILSITLPFNYIDKSCNKMLHAKRHNETYLVNGYVFFKDLINSIKYYNTSNTGSRENYTLNICQKYVKYKKQIKNIASIDYNDNDVNSLLFDVVYYKEYSKIVDIGEQELNSLISPIKEKIDSLIFTETDHIKEQELRNSKVKWLTPSRITCLSNGGRMREGQCQANWFNANNICLDLNRKLPTKEDFQELLVNCGAQEQKHINDNDKVKLCYQQNGFPKIETIDLYWLSNNNKIDKYEVFDLEFGSILPVGNKFIESIRCVKRKE